MSPTTDMNANQTDSLSAGPDRSRPSKRKQADAPLPPGVEILPPPFEPRDGIAGITALVIDRNKFQRDLIKSSLASRKVWSFQEAATIAEARDAVQSVDAIDLIVLENDLDGETGLEFTRRVRYGETKFDPAIPIVMVAAAASQGLVIEARNVGVHEFVSKPFDMGTLVDRAERPFRHPRTFVRAPGYVGPDRRWEKALSEQEKADYALVDDGMPRRRSSDRPLVSSTSVRGAVPSRS